MVANRQHMSRNVLTIIVSVLIETFILTQAGKLSQKIAQAILETEDAESPHDYGYIINHPEMCNKAETVKLLIVVHSAPDHLETRVAIRQTWGYLVGRKDVKMIFALGKVTNSDVMSNVVTEDLVYGDILQEDFLDTYRNLTLKTVMMVKWASIFCPSAKYLLKIDDDCFLNPDNLMTFLEQQENENDTQQVAIFGKVFKRATPFRNNESKWYVSHQQYPHLLFPDFVVGPSYVLTQRAVPRLYQMALKTAHVVLEDVFLNGLCATKANVTRINDDRFSISMTYDLCLAKLYGITYHNVTRSDIQLLWWMIHDTRRDHCQYYDFTNVTLNYYRAVFIDF